MSCEVHPLGVGTTDFFDIVQLAELNERTL